jgi:hypothetical protein
LAGEDAASRAAEAQIAAAADAAYERHLTDLRSSARAQAELFAALAELSEAADAPLPAALDALSSPEDEARLSRARVLLRRRALLLRRLETAKAQRHALQQQLRVQPSQSASKPLSAFLSSVSG